MGRKKKLENQAELIVDAAQELFDRYGFAKTTLEDIAKAVGIGKATLYSDFTNKEEILMAVVQRNQAKALEQMRLVIENSSDGPLKTLQNVLLQDALFTFHNMKKHFQDPNPIHPPPYLRGRVMGQSFFHQTLDEKAKLMAHLLDQAAAQGLILPLEDSLSQARMLRMALMSIKPPLMENRPDLALQPFLTTLIDMLLSGLKLPRNALERPCPPVN